MQQTIVISDDTVRVLLAVGRPDGCLSTRKAKENGYTRLRN
jgi:hypothetical protein